MRASCLTLVAPLTAFQSFEVMSSGTVLLA